MTTTLTEPRRRLEISKDNGWDDLCLRLGRRGWTATAVARHTNLTEGQVRTRWRKFGVSPMDERRGFSSEAKTFLASVRRQLLDMDKVLRAPQRGIF